MPTAKLTPEYQRRLVTKLDNIEKGIEFDNLSNCAPPGHPRWMTEPFLRDFVVTPDQTYLINEMQSTTSAAFTRMGASTFPRPTATRCGTATRSASGTAASS